MIISFQNRGTEDVLNGQDTKYARKTCPQKTWKVARRKLDLLDSAAELDDLRILPGNHLELLQGDREGQHSIRINDQYRICFIWTVNSPNDVEIVDYHTG